jgi:hypothetical protein
MTNTIFDSLENKAKEALERIKKEQTVLAEVARDLAKIENHPNLLPLGARVRLIEDWSTKTEKEVGSGWMGCKHFMTPVNYATIKDYTVSMEGKISYLIEFDRETFILSWGPDKGTERLVSSKHIFHFKPEHIRIV